MHLRSVRGYHRRSPGMFSVPCLGASASMPRKRQLQPKSWRRRFVLWRQRRATRDLGPAEAAAGRHRLLGGQRKAAGLLGSTASTLAFYTIATGSREERAAPCVPCHDEERALSEALYGTAVMAPPHWFPSPSAPQEKGRFSSRPCPRKSIARHLDFSIDNLAWIAKAVAECSNVRRASKRPRPLNV